MARAEILSKASVWNDIRSDIELAVESRRRVLLVGEHGVGKRLVARAIHEGVGSGAPFLTIEEVTALESPCHAGVRVEPMAGPKPTPAAHTHDLPAYATFFLDGVDRLSERAQSRLADTLADAPDLPLIAGCEEKIFARLAEGTFRRDLYYRLNTVLIEIPPLRQRRPDIFVLLEHYLRMYAKECGRPTPIVTLGAYGRIAAYDWPGNVRELQRVARSLIECHVGPSVGADDLPF